MAYLSEYRRAISSDDTTSLKQLDSLRKAAEGKLEQFRLEFEAGKIKPDAFKDELAPDKIISLHEFILVDIAMGGGKEIVDIADDLIAGDPEVVAAFKAQFKQALIGAREESWVGECTVRQWFPTIECGALLRVDVMAWMSDFSEQQRKSNANVRNVCCFIVFKSIARTRDLSQNQLGYFVAKSLNVTGLDDIVSRKEEIANYIAQLQMAQGAQDE